MQHIYPIVLSFFVTAMCFSFNMKEANFGKQDSLMLVTYYHNTTSASRLQCCSMCLEQEQCRSLSFNKVTYHCVMSDVPSIAVLAFSLGDPQSDVFSKKGWLLVFRAVAGIGPDPYLAFTNGTNVTSDDASCQTLYVTSCGRHYRSPFVDYWVNLSISKVKFAFYKNDTEVAFVLFDGKGTDITNWFDSSRILDSTWTDIRTQTFMAFSIAGNFDIGRRFIISVEVPCAVAKYYTVVVSEKVYACTHDDQPSFPQFFYSTSSSYGNPHLMFGMGKADFITIQIQ